MAEAPDDPKLDDDISKQLSKMLLQHQGINKAMKEGLFTMKDLVGLLQEYERRLDIVDNVLTESKLQHSKVNEILKENSKLIEGLGDVEKLSLQTRRDLAATYDAETQAASDLLLKRNMVATGLRGEYAQLLTTAMLQGDITDLNSEQGKKLVKELQHRQHNNELLEHEGEMYEHVAKMQLEINEELEKFSKGWSKIKATTKAIFQDPAFAKGVLFSGMIKGAEQLNHKMHEFMDVGMGAGEAVAAQFKALSVSSFLGLSKSEDVVKSMVGQYGSLNTLTDSQVDSVGKMAAANGLAAEEAFNMSMAISRMPGETRETAANSEAMLKSVAKTKGVIPGQLMKELAKNTANMALYSKGGAEGFAKAAASAKRMGVEIGNVLSAAEKTLDFESSINAQMEASVLLGREINMDRLRQAALSGDANAIMQEQQNLLKQVGNLDGMNLLQKKKLAEAMGLSVEEMTKMTDEANTQNKYFGEQAGIMSNIVGYTLKYGGGLVEGAGKAMPLLMSMSALMSLMGAKSLPQMAMGIWNMVRGLTAGVVQATLFLAKMIAIGAVKLFGGEGAVGKVKGFFDTKGKGFVDKIRGGGTKTPELPKTPTTTPGAGPEDKANKMGKIKAGDLIKAAAAMLIAAAAIYVFAKAIQELEKVKDWNNVAMGLGLFVATLYIAGKILSKAAPEMLIAAGVMIAFGAAVALFGLGLNLATPAIDAFGRVITAVFDGLAKLLLAAAVGISIIFDALQKVDIGKLLALGPAFVLLSVSIATLAAVSPLSILAAEALGILGLGIATFGVLAGLAAPGITATSTALISLSKVDANNFKTIGDGLLHIAKGLSAIGLAGLSALPVLGMLSGMSALGGTPATPTAPKGVAPISTPIPASTTPQPAQQTTPTAKAESSSDMKAMMEKLDKLIIVLQAGGTINMDGKKVADIVQRNIRTVKYAD